MSDLDPTLKELLEKMKTGLSHVEGKQGKDSQDKKEDEALETEERKAKVAGLQQDWRDKEANRKLRNEYAGKVFDYLLAYTFGAFILILLEGSGIGGFDLPDAALVVVVGSTAVSAIGLVGFVVSGLFK